MNNLMPDGRRELIVAELRSNGMLRATDLADRLGVTPVTIRRDIKQLTDEGVLRRVHGGAALNESVRMETPTSVSHLPLPETTIGILVPTLDYYWPGVIQGAKAEAELLGARLVLRSTSYEATDDRDQIKGLLDSGANGLVLAPDVRNEESVATLEWIVDQGIPVVLVEREAQLLGTLEPVEAVNTDHLAGARTAVQHLAELGHERIGYMASNRSPHRKDIRAGWKATIKALGFASGLDFELAFTSPTDQGGDMDIIEAAFMRAMEQGVTALLVHADREAMALTQIAQRHGLSVPGGLSIVAYDDEVAELFTPALTAVRPPRASIGKAAVQLIAERRADPGRPTHRIIVAPRLNIRDSTGPLLAD